MNDTLKTIYERYSCRAYTNQPPSDEQIKAIAQAALASPSAMNNQPWQILIVKNKELIEEMDAVALRYFAEMNDKTTFDRLMSRGGTVFYNATCMVVIAIKPGSELDCGIVSQNIALSATALGLGNVICGLARPLFTGEIGDIYKEKLSFPSGYEFGISVLIGNVAMTDEPHELDYNKVTYIK